MKRAYKTEIKPTQKQIQKINQSIGICRWLYNSYIAKNKELYEQYKQGLIPKEKPLCRLMIYVLSKALLELKN